jgi:uncharacterized protein YigE (DUF2233 family)
MLRFSGGMKRWWILLIVCGAARAAEVKEELVTHAGTRFRVVRLEPARVGLVWKDGSGETYSTFDRVQSDFARQGKNVKFLMNAGIYEPGGVPSGLHIEGGRMLRPANQAEGKGNFFLKPNGMMAGFANGKARIGTPESWDAWSKSGGPKVLYAAQSGPLLLIAGQRHPAFRDGSDSRLHRNGVGVDGEGRLVFAITAPGERVNFWDFAGLFLKLGCRDALFLDGDISQMIVNPDRPVPSNRFGAMFVVSDRE